MASVRGLRKLHQMKVISSVVANLIACIAGEEGEPGSNPAKVQA